MEYIHILQLNFFTILFNIILSPMTQLTSKHRHLKTAKLDDTVNIMFAFLITVSVKITDFWDAALCSLVEVKWYVPWLPHHQDRGSTFLWSVRILPPDYMTPHPKKWSSALSMAVHIQLLQIWNSTGWAISCHAPVQEQYCTVLEVRKSHT